MKNFISRFKKWVLSSGLSQLLMMEPTAAYNKYYVCNDHFDDSCFRNNSNNRLKNDAIPTKNICPFVSDSLINEYSNNLRQWQGKYKLKEYKS